MPTIEQKIDGFLQEHKSWRGRHDATLSGMQKQLDAMDANHQRPNYSGGGGGGGDLASEIFEAPEFKAFAQTGKGRFALNISDFQQKAAILSSTVGYSTPGVVGSERVGGIFPAAMSTYRVRNLLRQVPTTAGVIDFLRATSYTKGSPQAEADEKLEATIAFEDASEKMRTLAHWVPASRQVLQDVSGLQETINVHLMAGLRDLEDEEILSGDGSGEHLHGLIHLASSFDTGLLWAADGYEYSDVLGWAIGQLQVAKRPVSGMVLNPLDWWKIRLIKDGNGQYLFGNPASDSYTALWGVPCAVTNAIPQGTFLVGGFATGAALYIRMDGVIEVSDSHSDYFVRNKLAIRCEERLLLATYTPDAFVTGSFVQSPA